MNVGRSVVNSYFHSTDFPEWNNHPTVLRIRSLAMDVIEALKENEVKELVKRGNVHPDRKLLH